jgi:16S rRNA (adenine1518-N6/adenine1519-N6)-dimethyltransferase
LYFAFRAVVREDAFMQTISEIKRLLKQAGLRPNRRLGQCFLIDKNLLGKVVDLAELAGDETVLEVGAGTGTLTEELLHRAARVVAVEVDRRLAALLRRRLGEREGFVLIDRDVLAGKHALATEVTSALGASAHLVANLPYSIATPLVAQCLIDSWRASNGRRADLCRFDRLTFSVQREVADRLAAAPGGRTYGPVSVIVRLLGRLTAGAALPASAFWPRPKVSGRVVRIDFVPAAAARVGSIDTLRAIVRMAFGQRRKQIRAIVKQADAPFGRQAMLEGLAAAGIDPTWRAENVSPEQFCTMANFLDGPTGHSR